MCCHTEMPLTQDTTPHPVTIYRHGADLSLCYPRCGTSYWNTQLPIFMSWVRPAWEILPDLPHTPANAQLDAVMVVNSRKLSRKYRTNRVLNPGPVVCESSTLSARPQRLPNRYVLIASSSSILQEMAEMTRTKIKSGVYRVQYT